MDNLFALTSPMLLDAFNGKFKIYNYFYLTIMLQLSLPINDSLIVHDTLLKFRLHNDNLIDYHVYAVVGNSSRGQNESFPQPKQEQDLQVSISLALPILATLIRGIGGFYSILLH